MKTHTVTTAILALFCLLSSACMLHAQDNAHFYKAPRFQGEPYFKTKNWLFMADATYANGSTSRGRNNNGDKVGIFNIHGCQNLWYLTSGVCESADASTELQQIITDLNWTRTDYAAAEAHIKTGKDSFGQVEFTGKFEIDEFNVHLRQNLALNFFLDLDIPVRRLHVSNVYLMDKSPTSTLATNATANLYTQSDPRWINFIHTTTFNDILNSYGLKDYNKGYKKYHLGDITLMLGWIFNWEDPTDSLDSIRLAIKGGVLFPTGYKAEQNHPFGLSIGYNGHFGFPIRADLLFGMSSDVSLAAHFGIMFFKKETHDKLRIKTNEKQNGFIKLAQAKVEEDKGTLIDAGVTLKLDHFFKGLSALSGYSYNYRDRDHYTVIDGGGNCTDDNVADNDATLRSWDMHTLHFMAEYDFGTHLFFKKRRWQPRFGVFYEYPFDGKNIFTTPLTGRSIGTNLSWSF